MNLAINDKSFFQVKAIANDAILKIKKIYLAGDNEQSVYSNQYLYIIKEFEEHPEKFNIKKSPKIPDGSPIGSDICNTISN